MSERERVRERERDHVIILTKFNIFQLKIPKATPRSQANSSVASSKSSVKSEELSVKRVKKV